MKSSIYNIYKRGKSGYLLLNTLTNATSHIDEEIKRLLDENPGKIPNEILEVFFENGFVVEDICDERKVLAYHFDRDKYNIFLSNLAYTAVMTYSCNLRCPYCYRGSKKDTETLNIEKVDILLKNIDGNLSKKNFKAFELTLYGGEPLLAYHECVRLMEGASRICDHQNKEFKGKIITNGVLINEEVIDTLLKPYCNSIQITMDGGREAHNKRRIYKDGRGTYDTLLDVLELLRDTNINLILKLNLDRENADTFSELSRDLIDRGLGNIKKSLGRIHPPAAEKVGKIYASYAKKCISSEEMTDFYDKIYKKMVNMRIIRKLPENLRHSPCVFDREDAYVVDPYLDLYNCWEFLGQKDKKVGYINKNGEMVFNYEYYEQMSRNPLEFEECRDCKFLPLCGGGCAAYAYIENGTYHSSLCRKDQYRFQKYMNRVNSIMEEMLLSLSGSEI